MRSKCLKFILTFSVLPMITWAISCSGRSGSRTAITDKPGASAGEEPAIELISFILPQSDAEFSLGDQVKVSFGLAERETLPDSVLVFFEGKEVASIKNDPWECFIPSSFTSGTGRKSLKALAYHNGKMRTSITRFIVLLSDVVPERNTYRIINTYPHDTEAFTQGLFFYDGMLYEGTGETSSSLREVELASGKVKRQLNLSSSFFGEGITLYKDRIYQLTWKSKVGFVYDRSTFRQINKIYYQTDGWGLTTIDDRIVLSDGSNILYFMEPEMFTVVSMIEVYDNEKKVDQLNELEYINGEIWANIWTTDLIARIDPLSGKVLAYIDLKGIMKRPDIDTSENVLNGIAFDKENNRIFVTGKNWPELFEIKIIESR
jgi:glutamine cyclotransferase